LIPLFSFFHAEDIFALTVLLSDGYLRLKNQPSNQKEMLAKRFFEFNLQLPMELQMTLVRRVYLSKKLFFLSNQTERSLLKILSSY